MQSPYSNRRQFLAATGTAFTALMASGCMTRGASLSNPGNGFSSYGPLRADPAGMLDLPEGFSYRLL